MTFSANRANLDGFIDLVVEALVREIRNPTNAATEQGVSQTLETRKPRCRQAHAVLSKTTHDAKHTTSENTIAP